jgi:hypothetical protein
MVFTGSTFMDHVHALVITYRHYFERIRYIVHCAPLWDADSSFSQGFFRCALTGCVPCPVSTVFGISLMPGIGWPVVTSSTMCANEVGYGAGGSFAEGGGSIPPAVSVPVDSAGVCMVLDTSGGEGRELRYAL